MLIPDPELNFRNSGPKIHYWVNFGQKSQSCLFFQRIGTHGISRMLIFIPTLVFWISNPKSIFGQICAKQFKVVRFAWELAYMVSERCWFFEFVKRNPFFEKFVLKKIKVVWFVEKLAHMISERWWFLFWH